MEGAERFFDRTAAGYARARYGARARPFHRAFFGTRLRLAAEAVAHLGPGDTVVDLGCGPAPLTALLRARGVRVVGVDFAPGMLHVAREAGALVARGDVRAVPLRDGLADAVLILGVTTYLEDPDPALEEARRLLKPGGTLVVTATNAASPDTRLRHLARGIAGRLRRRSASVLVAAVPVHAHRPAAFEARLRKAEFDVLDRRGHNYTLFPFGRLLEVPSVWLSRAAEAARLPAGLASDTVFTARKPGGGARSPRPRGRPVRVLRAIARLNVGGPAMHVALLNQGLDRRGFRSTLVCGRCEPGEADMSDYARDRGVEPVVVRALGRSVSPLDDLRSFGRLLAVVRGVRPDVLHTHTAKAGALGRLAGLIAGVPVRIHTFHGHVFRGYFGALGTRVVIAIERALGRGTHRLLAVSDEVRRDLVEEFRIAPAARATTVPLGLDLAPFARAAEGEHRGRLRAEIGAAADEPLIGIVGRLVPIKDHAYFLEAGAALLATHPRARLVVVGGGDLEADLRRRAAALGIADRCAFLGWRRDTAVLAADLDVVALTSRNEGTPVALIEAAAAGCRIVARDVGGVASALAGVDTADRIPADAPPEEFGRRMGLAVDAAAGTPRHPDPEVLRRFSVERLCDDIERIYREELARARGPHAIVRPDRGVVV